MLLTVTMPADEFERTVEQLYAGPPDQFIAQRDAAVKQARAAGDRELADQLKALRRPTVAAALLNQLHRRDDHGGLDELLALGEKLRAAQSTLDVASMRSLSTERNSLVSRLVSQIAETADEPPSSAVQEQLSDTLVAAVADAEAGRAVGSGRLVSGLRYSGFGDVDLQDAVAIPLRSTSGSTAETDGNETAGTTPEPGQDTGPSSEADAERRLAERRAAAEQRLAEASAALEAARRAESSAQQSAALAERALDAARHTARSTRARAEQAAAARSAAEQAVAAAEQDAASTTRS